MYAIRSYYVLDELATPPRSVTLQGMQEAGLGKLVNSLIVERDGDVQVLTLIPDRPDLVHLVEKDMPGEAHLVSQGRFRREVGAAIGKDFFRFILLALMTVLVLLTVLFRSVGKIAAAAVPVVTGLAVMFGVMGALGLDFNLFNVIASILVIGLGVDYGIFMVCKTTECLDRATNKAVLASGLTTLAGFGAAHLGQNDLQQLLRVSRNNFV